MSQSSLARILLGPYHPWWVLLTMLKKGTLVPDGGNLDSGLKVEDEVVGPRAATRDIRRLGA